MKLKQECRLSMFLAVRDYLTANAAITTPLPSFTGYFTAVQSGITSIQAIREQQEFDKTGIAVNKTQLKTTLIAQTIDISRKVQAYATITNNPVLLGEVKYSESDLKKCADTILRDRCQVVYTRANTNATALVTYGITPVMITSMQTAITNFNAAIPKPRLGINEKKQATTQLSLLFDTVDSNLTMIDALVEIIRGTQANFYNGYKNARKVIMTGMNSLALKGSAVDAESGLAMGNVKFTFIPDDDMLKAAGSNGKEPLVKITAAKGNFNVSSMPEGSYTVTVSKPGYRDQVVTVSVVDGELAKVDVMLEKA